MEIILASIVAFGVGWLLREAYAVYRINSLINKLESVEENEEAIPQEVFSIIIEKHNDIFFCYSAEDGAFMAQGNTREELEEHLRELYPHVIMFGASNDNLENVGFK
jgi:predicted RNase H-like HicB family nuclease